MRDIGDRHVQAEATGKQFPATELLAVNGIIEVTRILAVDGDERQVAKVNAFLLVLLLDFRLELGGFAFYRIRPDMRDVEAAKRDIDLHTGSHVVADDLDHVALWLKPLSRPVRNLDLDELTRLGIHGSTRRDQHLLLDLGVISHHKADSTFFLVAAYDGFVGTTDDLNNRTFAAAAAIKPGHASQTAITVKHQTHLCWTQEQIVAAVIRDEKTETVAMAADATANQVQLVDRGIGATPGIDHLTVTLHRAQTAAQSFNVIFGG